MLVCEHLELFGFYLALPCLIEFDLDLFSCLKLDVS